MTQTNIDSSILLVSSETDNTTRNNCQSRSYKKLQNLLLVATTFIFLSGCGGHSDEAKDPQAAAQENGSTNTDPDPDTNPVTDPATNPDDNNQNSTQTPKRPCTIIINPGDSFTEAFGLLSTDETLCLNDGLYQQAMDIPSGLHVQAVNDGMAEIDGMSSLGEEWSGGLVQLKGSNSSVRGLRVHHAHRNADACLLAGTNNTARIMSCSHGGSHWNKVPMKTTGSGHLVEDSWFYGEGRYTARCFLGDNITFRRNVARWDKTAAGFPTEPNAAFSIYNCSEMTIENNISLDYGVPETRMRFGGDFYSPQNASVYPTGNQDNHYLGNIVINHAPDTDNNRAFRLDASTDTYGNVARDFYVRNSAAFILGNSRIRQIEIGACTLVNVANNGSVPGNNDIQCNNDADITHRYVSRVKTTDLLFPWTNEAMIKEHLCASGERQSDWCLTSKTLTEYVLGN